MVKEIIVYNEIESGKTVYDGFGGEKVTAPAEHGVYELVEEYYDDDNTHKGFFWRNRTTGETISAMPFL